MRTEAPETPQKIIYPLTPSDSVTKATKGVPMNVDVDGARILAVCALPPPIHGQSAATQCVVGELAKRSGNIKIVNTSPGSLTRSSSYHFRRFIKHTLAILYILGCKRPDRITIYTVAESGLGIMYNYLVIVAARLRGIRMVIHHHTANRIRQKSLLFGKLLSISGPETINVVLSQNMARDFKQTYEAPGSILTCGNASFVRSSTIKRSGSTLNIGHLSNLSLEKGIDKVVDAMLALMASGLDVRFEIAGPVKDDEARRQITRALSGLGNRLQYIGPIAGVQKADFYSRCDLFLFPSRYSSEAQPLTLIEALEAGCLIVASRQGYIEETLNGAAVTVDLADFVSSVLETARLLVTHSSREKYQQLSHNQYVRLRSQSEEELRCLTDALLDKDFIEGQGK